MTRQDVVRQRQAAHRLAVLRQGGGGLVGRSSGQFHTGPPGLTPRRQRGGSVGFVVPYGRPSGWLVCTPGCTGEINLRVDVAQ